MRQSQLFTKTRREAPKDEVSKNAKLLIRGGFIHKEMAGVYSYLPLGLRVLKKIEGIIREEMNSIGGQEIEMTALQSPELWQKTDRWDDEKVDVWFKTELQGGGELGLGFTHEEPLTNALSRHISSHKDLPVYVYQFQNKFRNELRAKSGIMRGREFLMKDLYSFSKTEEEHADFYEKAKEAYGRIFSRVGIGDITYFTYASGGSFSKYSHEFQTLTESGEDSIHTREDNELVAINGEVLDEVVSELGWAQGELVEKKAVEVGNIFSLGTKFSEPLGLTYRDEHGDERSVIMGSYGIGLGRLMGTVVEVLSDEKGIVWPESIAPFQVHLVVIAGEEGGGIRTKAEELYMELVESGVEVLYDDREDTSPGEKFADADLMGIPVRVVISKKTLKEDSVEVKKRTEEEGQLIKHSSILDFLQR